LIQQKKYSNTDSTEVAAFLLLSRF